MMWNRKWWTQAWRLTLVIAGLSKGHMSLKAAQATYEFQASLGSRVNPQARGRKRKDGRSYTRKMILQMQTIELEIRGPEVCWHGRHSSFYSLCHQGSHAHAAKLGFLSTLHMGHLLTATEERHAETINMPLDLDHQYWPRLT